MFKIKDDSWNLMVQLGQTQEDEQDDSKLELLWRVRVETTRNHCRLMQDNCEIEEDAARMEIQRAYFAGAARAWELAGVELDKLLQL